VKIAATCVAASARNRTHRFLRQPRQPRHRRIAVGGKGDEYVSAGGIFHEGQVFAVGDIGPVKVAHDVIGDEGFASGEIRSHGALTSVTVGGSMIGSGGLASGQIASEGDMGPVKIGHDVKGGLGAFTGDIHGYGKVISIFIGGSLVGGPGAIAGIIEVDGALGSLTVKGSVIGDKDYSGRITGASIGSVKIGGSLVGGAGVSSGQISSGATWPVKIGAIAGGSGCRARSLTGARSQSWSRRLGHRRQRELRHIHVALSFFGQFSPTKIGAVTVAWSSAGCRSGGHRAGEVHGSITGRLGLVKIGRDRRQRHGIGRVLSDTTLDVVSIGGSAAARVAGEVFSTGAMGAVKIGGDVTVAVAVGISGTGSWRRHRGSLVGGQAFASEISLRSKARWSAAIDRGLRHAPPPIPPILQPIASVIGGSIAKPRDVRRSQERVPVK
jgi:hypothetical protein